MTTADSSAQILHVFACRAAESRMLVVRGSVSTQVDVPVTDTLAIVNGDNRLVLVGEGQDVGFNDVGVADVGEALATDGAVIEAGPVRFPLSGDLTIERIGDTTIMITIAHRRSNGMKSGAIDRMILTVLYGSAL